MPDEITLLSRTDQLAAYDVVLPPGGGPPMLHRHAACELYRIERGRLAFYIEDDAIFAPGAQMERFAAAARGEADMARVLELAADHGIEITRPVTEMA